MSELYTVEALCDPSGAWWPLLENVDIETAEAKKRQAEQEVDYVRIVRAGE